MAFQEGPNEAANAPVEIPALRKAVEDFKRISGLSTLRNDPRTSPPGQRPGEHPLAQFFRLDSLAPSANPNRPQQRPPLFDRPELLDLRQRNITQALSPNATWDDQLSATVMEYYFARERLPAGTQDLSLIETGANMHITRLLTNIYGATEFISTFELYVKFLEDNPGARAHRMPAVEARLLEDARTLTALMPYWGRVIQVHFLSIQNNPGEAHQKTLKETRMQLEMARKTAVAAGIALPENVGEFPPSALLQTLTPVEARLRDIVFTQSGEIQPPRHDPTMIERIAARVTGEAQQKAIRQGLANIGLTESEVRPIQARRVHAAYINLLVQHRRTESDAFIKRVSAGEVPPHQIATLFRDQQNISQLIMQEHLFGLQTVTAHMYAGTNGISTTLQQNPEARMKMFSISERDEVFAQFLQLMAATPQDPAMQKSMQEQREKSAKALRNYIAYMRLEALQLRSSLRLVDIVYIQPAVRQITDGITAINSFLESATATALNWAIWGPVLAYYFPSLRDIPAGADLATIRRRLEGVRKEAEQDLEQVQSLSETIRTAQQQLQKAESDLEIPLKVIESMGAGDLQNPARVKEAQAALKQITAIEEATGKAVQDTWRRIEVNMEHHAETAAILGGAQNSYATAITYALSAVGIVVGNIAYNRWRAGRFASFSFAGRTAMSLIAPMYPVAETSWRLGRGGIGLAGNFAGEILHDLTRGTTETIRVPSARTIAYWNAQTPSVRTGAGDILNTMESQIIKAGQSPALHGAFRRNALLALSELTITTEVKQALQAIPEQELGDALQRIHVQPNLARKVAMLEAFLKNRIPDRFMSQVRELAFRSGVCGNPSEVVAILNASPAVSQGTRAAAELAQKTAKGAVAIGQAAGPEVAAGARGASRLSRVFTWGGRAMVVGDVVMTTADIANRLRDAEAARKQLRTELEQAFPDSTFRRDPNRPNVYIHRTSGTEFDISNLLSDVFVDRAREYSLVHGSALLVSLGSLAMSAGPQAVVFAGVFMTVRFANDVIEGRDRSKIRALFAETPPQILALVDPRSLSGLGSFAQITGAFNDTYMNSNLQPREALAQRDAAWRNFAIATYMRNVNALLAEQGIPPQLIVENGDLLGLLTREHEYLLRRSHYAGDAAQEQLQSRIYARELVLRLMAMSLIGKRERLQRHLQATSGTDRLAQADADRLRWQITFLENQYGTRAAGSENEGGLTLGEVLSRYGQELQKQGANNLRLTSFNGISGFSVGYDWEMPSAHPNPERLAETSRESLTALGATEVMTWMANGRRESEELAEGRTPSREGTPAYRLQRGNLTVFIRMIGNRLMWSSPSSPGWVPIERGRYAAADARPGTEGAHMNTVADLLTRVSSELENRPRAVPTIREQLPLARERGAQFLRGIRTTTVEGGSGGQYERDSKQGIYDRNNSMNLVVPDRPLPPVQESTRGTPDVEVRTQSNGNVIIRVKDKTVEYGCIGEIWMWRTPESRDTQWYLLNENGYSSSVGDAGQVHNDIASRLDTINRGGDAASLEIFWDGPALRANGISENYRIAPPPSPLSPSPPPRRPNLNPEIRIQDLPADDPIFRPTPPAPRSILDGGLLPQSPIQPPID